MRLEIYVGEETEMFTGSTPKGILEIAEKHFPDGFYGRMFDGRKLLAEGTDGELWAVFIEK